MIAPKQWPAAAHAPATPGCSTTRSGRGNSGVPAWPGTTAPSITPRLGAICWSLVISYPRAYSAAAGISCRRAKERHFVIIYLKLSQLTPHPENPRLAPRADVVTQIAAQLNGAMDDAHALIVRPVGET